MQADEFEKLALAHLDAVYRLSLRLTRSSEKAEDLVQDTFARAFRPQTIERFDPAAARPGASAEEGMRAWLFTICHNLFYSQIKRQARAPVAVGEFYGQASADPLPERASTGNMWTIVYKRRSKNSRKIIERCSSCGALTISNIGRSGKSSAFP